MSAATPDVPDKDLDQKVEAAVGLSQNASIVNISL